jgi:ubiquinone/menaquinone biosynthesis C-methylase UbiE
MGLYAKYVLPRLIDLGMRNPESTRLRREWIPRASGEVLEIGIGSGLNLPFYAPGVQRVYGVDPSLELQQMARERAASVPVKVEFLSQSAEDPLPPTLGAIDTAVVTWTLCSIPDPTRVLDQLLRILKPGGSLIFIEHGRAPEPSVAGWQDRATPVWKHIAGGCTLNRKMDELITAAGFRITELQTSYLRGPRMMTYTYRGVAIRT